MKYNLVKPTNDDIKILIEYKKNIIYEYAKDLSKEEVDKINNYVENNVPKLLNQYSIIKVNNEIIGCLLVTPKDDGVLIDELFLEEKYRNKGIGTNIINKVLKNNNIVYLWVYKDNIKAVSLYKRIGFKIIEETESRYYMQYK